MTTFCEATINWLRSKPDLADASHVAYRGEINRMAEHLLRADIPSINTVCREDWWEYLLSLENERQGVQTKRRKTLRLSSIQQARRITRDFFMWALEDRIIDWIPLLPNLVSQTNKRLEQPKKRQAVSNELLNVLLGEITHENMVECRAHLVLNLVFWGAMTPAELVRLKAKDLYLGKGKTVCRLSEREVVLPKHIRLLWKDYISYRSAEHETPPKNESPLIAHIARDNSVSKWGIWAIFKAWHKHQSIHENEHICPRKLRAIYLDMICSDGTKHLAMTCRYGGLKERRVLASDIPSKQLTIDSLNKEIARRIRAAPQGL